MGFPILVRQRLCIESGPSTSFETYIKAYGPRTCQPYSHTLQWRHGERDGVSNHQPHDCLLNRLFRRRSKKTSKLSDTGLCDGNSPVTGEFLAQKANNAENVCIWRRHHTMARRRFATCSRGLVAGIWRTKCNPAWPPELVLLILWVFNILIYSKLVPEWITPRLSYSCIITWFATAQGWGNVHFSDWFPIILRTKKWFQGFSNSSFDYDYMHQLWNYAYYISTKIH